MQDELIQRLYNLECSVRKLQNMQPIVIPSDCAPGNILYIQEDGTLGCKEPEGGEGPGPEPTTFVARWGWKDTNALPTESEITSSPGNGTFNSNADITTNFSAAPGPKYLFMAEPVAQPQKYRWYASATNNEVIGSNTTFVIAGVVAGYRVYMTSFMTEFSSPVQFQNT